LVNLIIATIIAMKIERNSVIKIIGSESDEIGIELESVDITINNSTPSNRSIRARKPENIFT